MQYMGSADQIQPIEGRSQVAGVLMPVLKTLRGWSVDALPRVGEIVEEMDQALQSTRVL